ncbi:hypothetical protein [uncultured Piscinibacter sp.]|uniref:tetratricopeptide repeat protein n=1 Tax=uncultured Piscinibacter sp. TaxID=1131835 RepID=UPI00261733B2|nr:hypothetical protein [uncultured Piscinibacter sp.]
MNGLYRRLVLSTALALLALAGQAQEIPGYPAIEAFDAREVAMLPPYCKYTIYFRDKVPGGADPDSRARWLGTLGPTFEHLHHYCFGLMKTNRAVLLSRDSQTTQFYLRESLREYDYVLDRARPDFVLLPEVLSKKGENLIRLKREPLAILEFERAASLRPDYWPPFAHMGDYYASIGDRAKAREVLQRGLQGSPDAQALKRRINELDDAEAKGSTRKK